MLVDFSFLRAVLGNKLVTAEVKLPTFARHEIPNPGTTMEVEGILFIVKYFRTVNNYLDIMIPCFPGKSTEQSALQIPTKLLRFGPGLSPSNRVGIFKPPYFFQ